MRTIFKKAWTVAVLTVVAMTAHAETASEGYARIHAEATRIAGQPMDMPRRAMFLDRIYRDSNGNHGFPLVALHGALWGYQFFKVTGPIGKAFGRSCRLQRIFGTSQDGKRLDAQ